MIASEAAVRRAALTHAAAGIAVAAIVAIVCLVVGLGALWSLLAGLLVGAAAAVTLYLRQEAIVLSAIGARPLEPGEHPRLENLVEGLCVSNGFRRPSLHLVDDAAPNMLMVGRHPRHAALAVTSGLLESLGRVELEALIAHQLTRMRNRTTQLETTVGVIVGRPLSFAPGLAAKIAGRLLDPDTSAETDVVSVSLTRYPPGLAAALRSLAGDGREVVANPVAFRHMWVAPPPGAIAPSNFDLDTRVAVLEEL
jgi:heat shock protein HtpX